MLRTHFKTSLRYLWKNKVFSLINIIGLVTGICVCFFALLYVHFELNHDSYNERANYIYRVVTDIRTPSGITYESTSAPVGPAIKASFPEVKDMARVFLDDMILQSNPNNANKEQVAYADSSVFKLFTWPLLRGNLAHMFDAPNQVVLSETAAKRYFNNRDPLGQTLLINGKGIATVVGIMKDIPYNSHLRTDFIFSISTLVNEGWSRNWKRFGFYTYLLLQNSQSPTSLQAKLSNFVNTHFQKDGFNYQLALEPLKSIYLYGMPRGHRTGASSSGSISNVYIISIVAVLVLFIACFNFINLSTAVSLQRAKEIGVRKVLGSSRYQLTLQFFADSIVLCLASFIIAVLLAACFLPLFNTLIGTMVSSSIFGNSPHILWLLLISVVVGILSGIYPALYLSGLKPINSLKAKMGSSSTGFLLRRSLVVAQFAISIFLLVATGIIYLQLDYMQNHQLGFQKDHKLVIDYQFDSLITQHAARVKQDLMNIPGVSMVSFSSSIPGTSDNQLSTSIQNNKGENQLLKPDTYFIDDAFLSQFHIDLIAGRGFDKNLAIDSMKSMLINQSMLRSLGFSRAEDAIGKRFSQLNHEGSIVGVVKDFHNHSFLETIKPLTFRVNPSHLTNITINIRSDDVGSTIGKLQVAWRNIAPSPPLIYFFADEAYNMQYIAQQRFGQLFICFALIAIILSCLGLVGLSVYNIEQRKKEIGIRKILGASVGNIALMLSKDFVKLILIAFFIISPISWWLINHWLLGFAYRINIPTWVFVSSGVLTLFIALFTISLQSVKAAIVNPIKSLKSE